MLYIVESKKPLAVLRATHVPLSGGSATLGYAVPAVIGAKVAHPDRCVVAAVGDERRTVRRDQAPAGSHVRGGTETDLANPDFVTLARAFAGERIEDLDDLAPALGAALGQQSPTLIELRMTVLPPWEL